MNRRGFLSSLIAAPAIVRSEIIMPINPVNFSSWEGGNYSSLSWAEKYRLHIAERCRLHFAAERDRLSEESVVDESKLSAAAWVVHSSERVIRV